MTQEKLEKKHQSAQSREFLSHEKAIEAALRICEILYSSGCLPNEDDRNKRRQDLENSAEHIRAGQFNVSVADNEVHVCVADNPLDQQSASEITEAWKKI